MNNEIKRLLELFNSNESIYKLSNYRIVDRYSSNIHDVIKAKSEFRYQKHAALVEYCQKKGIPKENVKFYWHKSKKFSLNVSSEPKESFAELKDRLIAEMESYAPKYPQIKRVVSKDPHLLVLDPCDIHIGKLASSFETGESYNSQVAVQRVKEGVQSLLNKSSGYQFDKILFVIGNDVLHIDNPRRTTTSGTPQDTDGMWYENFLMAKQLYVEIIEMLLTIADVHIQYDPSNHDYTSGFFLADTIKTWFRNNPHVTCNTSLAHRKYFAYGENLIGTTHGDGAKEHDLPLLMAQESPSNWAKCKHRYIYTHHLHHKKSKDYGSVCVESLRSPSSTDGWHHKSGYQHAPKAIEAYIHHPVHGQISRLTHIF